ncbi:MAG: bifunctional diguanylate cyclase/phosphodiesterase [Agarilytica sp.]
MTSLNAWAALLQEQLSRLPSESFLLSPLLRHLPFIIFVSDEHGNVVLSSAYSEKLLGALEGADRSGKDTPVGRGLLSEKACQRIALLNVQDVGKDTDEQLTWEELDLSFNDGSKRNFLAARFAIPSDENTFYMTLAHEAFDGYHVNSHLRDYKIQSQHLAFNDGVTGLANRTLFFDRLDQAFYSSRRNNNHFALMLIDLDQFNLFVQNYGSYNGDRYLKNLASRMLEVVREVDTVARIGGDKFVVILDNINDPEQIQSVARKLLEASSSKITAEIDGQETLLECAVSIGISLYPKDGDSPDQLLRQADTAMSRAKAAGKNQHQFYIKTMTESAVNYLLLENELKKAIEGDELQLYFQPQVDIRNGEVCGLEVLCRWQHPKRGLLQPGYFIPLAEETGLIEPLGEWVLKKSVALFNRWMALGYDFGRISVNVSAKQFRNPDFVKLIREVLDESDLPEFRLELELTESATMENASQAVENLKQLKQAGVAIALDDFGTGYSSLSYLQRFPIQRLKIDKSFVDEVDKNESSAATAKSIIDLANNMSLEIVAEGVEREGQANWLLARGCYVIQGALFSEPLSETELTALAHDEKRTKFEKGMVSFLL